MLIVIAWGDGMVSAVRVRCGIPLARRPVELELAGTRWR
jgi:hypothetical protein